MADLLDANCFIESHQRWYGLDFCPGFWSRLEQQNDQGRLFSIDTIRDKLVKIDNDLKGWVQRQSVGFFLPVDSDTVQCYSQIAQRLQSSSNLAMQHVARFLSGADPWLISFAMAHGHTVVTQEKLVDASSRKVKIPNVCAQFQVRYSELVPIIRASGARLELR